jgi:hypothetical protein
LSHFKNQETGILQGICGKTRNLKQRVEANNRTAAPKNPGSGLSISVVPARGLSTLEQCVMYELLSKFDPGGFVGLVSVVGAFACAIVAIVMGIRLEYRRVELKKDMLERGMTAEEIRIVMEAGSKNSQRLCKGSVEAEV